MLGEKTGDAQMLACVRVEMGISSRRKLLASFILFDFAAAIA